jgi:hypothetical protein
MKKLLLLFSITVALSAQCTRGQTSVYHPFPDSDAVWRIDWGVSWCFDNSWPQAKYRYMMNGDTIVNGFTYHKIVREFGFGSYVCGPTYPPGSGYMGGLRQDTALKKVFFIPNDSTNEKLLYDFNLNIGDTINFFILNKTYNLIVDNIDSVQISNLSYRKGYSLNSGVHYCGLTEGIGSTTGLLEPPDMVDFNPQLVCFIQDSIQLYGISACNLPSQVANINETIDLKMFPNPFHSTATIEIKNEELKIKNLELKMYDVMGRLVQSQIITNQSTIINREDLGDGLYFYQLRTKDYEPIASGKFVVD